MQPNRKMNVKWNNGKVWEFRIDSSFWYYKDGENFYRLFLDNNGLWLGKREKNDLDNFTWVKQKGFTLEMNEGVLKY